MTRRTLDDDPLGRRLDRLLPRPLRRRITAEHAAVLLADGISRRAARTVAPGAWQPYALLRGVVNIAVDHKAVKDQRLHTLLHDVEQRDLSS